MTTSIRFYEALGFERRAKATGEQVAFFDAGGVVLALYPWDKLAEDADARRRAAAAGVPRHDAGVELQHRRRGRRGDGACAVPPARRRSRQPHETFYGGYSGYFTDPDGHPWEVVCAPGVDVQPDGRVSWLIDISELRRRQARSAPSRPVGEREPA